MSCFNLTARAVPPVVCLMLVLGAVGGARAEDGKRCASDSNVCDLQKDRTFLRSAIWSGSCQPSQWDSLPPEGFPVEKPKGENVFVLKQSLHAPVNFLNGVCQLHKEKGADLDLGISELQRAQTQGLMASQRNLASLFEGLLHCRQLSALKEKYADDLTEQTASRERFCLHRGMAKASFTHVNWANLELRYEDPERSLEKHVETMAQCYADFLHAGFDASCGLVASPSDGPVLETVATAAADPVLASYFGAPTQEASSDAGVSPLQAMLARKLQMANAAVKGSEGMFDDLERKNELLTASYQSLGEEYCTNGTAENKSLPCTGSIPTSTSRLHQAYRKAVLEAQQVIDFVDKWISGLFQLKGRDVRDDLEKSTKALSETLERVPPLLKELERVKHDMAELADTQADTKAVLSMCGVYFCELRGNANKNRFQKACDQLDSRTGRKLSESNKLCAPEAEKTFLSEDSRDSAFGVCEAAGFPVDLMTKPRLSVVETQACMQRFHP